MNLGINVGDTFQFNHQGVMAQVTAVKGRKVKFEVFAKVPMYGSMSIREFLHRYKGKVAA